MFESYTGLHFSRQNAYDFPYECNSQAFFNLYFATLDFNYVSVVVFIIVIIIFQFVLPAHFPHLLLGYASYRKENV